MLSNKSTDNFISDEGIITTKKRVKVTFFVYLCRVLTIALAILGVMALIIGNM
ncbi:MAG: hypothetical protein K6E92_01450 [Lachnospiraceae bacterium]|nr:hypothetical protein [Lachnospiraceae bacterium]